jgi:hypothetical protein
VALGAKLKAAPGLKASFNLKKVPMTLIGPSVRNLIANSFER